MKHLLLSAFSGYSEVSKVRNLVHSWNAVKKDGDEFIVATSGEKTPCHEFLEENGVRLVWFDQARHPYHDRFLWFSEIIRMEGRGASHVLAVDIRDVVFQYNPFDWLKIHRDKALVACDEGIFHDEEWNGFMMKQAFGGRDKDLAKLPVKNCGVIAGSATAVEEVCFKIYKDCTTIPYSGTHEMGEVLIVGDQAAYSLQLADRNHYINTTAKENWCVTLGVIANQLDLLNCEGGQLLNPKGEAYAIVHQYDRHEVIHYDLANNKFYAQKKGESRVDDFTLQCSS